ncbi:hypothetical protein RB195_016846 [Necator americanus]|uniref:Sulfotransferase domain-containing protein n=1 Tax=Necator americanus TaxID=51031 RepID=A0ABR1C2F3_NECAM
MSTFRCGMFCYLNRRRKFEEAGRSISTEHWSNPFCKDEWNERKTFVDAVNSLKKDAVIFAIIRDPVDRFLSGYTNKCIK